jgi:hypothetical protein
LTNLRKPDPTALEKAKKFVNKYTNHLEGVIKGRKQREFILTDTMPKPTLTSLTAGIVKTLNDNIKVKASDK